MAKIAHNFETHVSATASPEPPTRHAPVITPEPPTRQVRVITPEPEVPKESPTIPSPALPPSSPSPPPTVTAPLAHTHHHVTQTLEGWNLAQEVEEVDDSAWRETDEQEDAWREDEVIENIQENSNLETVAEETGTGLVAVALYDYQAAAEDELSFDPDDIINNIEMVRNSKFFILNYNYNACYFLLD